MERGLETQNANHHKCSRYRKRNTVRLSLNLTLTISWKISFTTKPDKNLCFYFQHLLHKQTILVFTWLHMLVSVTLICMLSLVRNLDFSNAVLSLKLQDRAKAKTTSSRGVLDTTLSFENICSTSIILFVRSTLAMSKR